MSQDLDNIYSQEKQGQEAIQGINQRKRWAKTKNWKESNEFQKHKMV